MQTFLLSLTGRTKLKGILEIVTSATEFEGIQIRRHEDNILSRIYERLPVKMAETSFESPHFKAFVLLQAHFSRMQLPIDLSKDQELILRKVLNLLSACVDVLSSEGHLNATSAMEMSQMVVQSMWNTESLLKQIPHFDSQALKAAKEFGINDIYGFMDAMDPEENPQHKQLLEKLGLSNQQLADAAKFTNEFYPNIELAFEVEDPENVVAGSPSFVNITIERELEEDEEPKTEVYAPFFPGSKSENWWLIVGEESTKNLLAIKRITIGKSLQTKLEYVVPTPGRHELTLYLMSDSYLGVDQAPTFEVIAAEGMDDDEDEEDEEDEDD